MDKYRQFEDGSTGINPFLPHWHNYHQSPVKALIKFIIMFPIAMARMLLFTIAMAILATVSSINSNKIWPIECFRRHIYVFWCWIGCGTALFAMGVLWCEECLADHRKLKLVPPKVRLGGFGDYVHGSIFYANHSSLVDVLWFGMKFCPTFFVFVSKDGNPVHYRIFEALFWATSKHGETYPGMTYGTDDTCVLSSIYHDGPVVVFPEGARTNGTALLKWRHWSFKNKISFKEPFGSSLVAFEYPKEGAYTLHHTVGGAFEHVFWCCYQPWHTMKITWLPDKDFFPAIKPYENPHGIPDVVSQIQVLRETLSRLCNMPEVEIGAGEFLEFQTLWDMNNRQGSAKARKKKV
eukprot:gnl/TRDRNA2_/TRDRNA2_35930_c0_seq1.p1 gnl/TRDRNA2_/TRDRNA2_35930_c0~~gnl/TRDRNA2_/TRDRNA2_35930_c0_seq1.p1  ORF type:complete len:350 (-),score=54.44 gnl/TRDRNA2_/TRDRNA2_35930_c0_seq1:100-1149(-)